jgi:hypothetical protein
MLCLIYNSKGLKRLLEIKAILKNTGNLLLSVFNSLI